MSYPRTGTIAPILKQWEIKFSPTQGARLNKSYHGTDLPQMIALANTYAATYTGTLKWGGATAELTLESTDSSGVPGGFSSPAKDIVDKWEIGVDQEKPDLFRNVNYLNMFAVADAAYASYGAVISLQVAHVIRSRAGKGDATWHDLVKDFNATKVVKADNTFFPVLGVDLTLGALIQAQGLNQGIKYFADDYFAGSTNFIKSAYVLKHTTSAPSTYAANVTDFNVEKLYRISELLAEANNASLWILPLPGFLNYKILNYAVPLTLLPNYYWSALKLRASAQTSYRNRIEIQQEYIIDSFGRHTYPLAFP